MQKDKKNQYQRFVWIGSILVVFFVGLYYFPKEYEGLTFWESVYHTIRLFVLEQDLPHFPTSLPLIAIHFIAPLIAFSALWYVVKYLFHISPRLKSRWIRDHVVVCGVGRTGKIIATTLRDRGVRVVGVDMGPDSGFEEWCTTQKIPIIFGDFHSQVLLKQAGAERARSVIFAAGDDLANLEGAVSAYDTLRRDTGRVRLIWSHIADERLADTARGAVRTNGVVGIRFFDTYRIAATRMIGQYFNPEMRVGVKKVTILGFGKFGRDLAEILLRDLGPEDDFLISIIDQKDVRRQVEELSEELGAVERVSFMQADVQELRLVDEVDKAFFICTDDDLGNLTAAMMLACKVTCTHIYVRMATWPLSAMAEHLGEDRGVTFVNINDLVVQGIGQLRGIFEPASPSDLKRTSTAPPPRHPCQQD